MPEALTMRGLSITQLEQLPEVLPTADPQLGAVIRPGLERHIVDVHCTRVAETTAAAHDGPSRLQVLATDPHGAQLRFPADVVLVVVGVRPRTGIAAWAGAELGIKGAIQATSKCARTWPTCSRFALLSRGAHPARRRWRLVHPGTEPRRTASASSVVDPPPCGG